MNRACRLKRIAVIGAAIFCPFFLLAQTRQLLRGNIPSAIKNFHLQPLHDFPAASQLRLAIRLPLRNQSQLDQLLAEIYDPASTNYHRYLTPQEFTEKFGPTPRDYDAVIAFARTNGMAVTGTYSNRALVDVTGNAAALEKAFHTRLRVYRHPTENRNFFAPDTEPSLDLAVPILHVSGLSDFTIPKPAAIKKLPLKKNSTASPANGSANGLFIGTDFRKAYAPGVTLDGSGQVVGLLELEGYYTNDIAAYENQAGLPHIAITNVAIDGFALNSADETGIIECSLDIEMAISMATNLSQVIVYEAPNNNVGVEDLLNRIVSDNLAKQISSSWLPLGNGLDAAYQQMAVQGQSFFQASGDYGAYYSGISQWSDDTNITIVGGTSLTTDTNGAWSAESAWSNSGGGVSFNNVSIPSWQTGISMTGNSGSTTLRNVPDVAMPADNIFVIANNGAYSGGVSGTSCAAPLWAGFIALVNQQAALLNRPSAGFLNPAIYAIGKSANYTANFHDIVSGSNTNAIVGTNYFAVPGYDLCTGWGTPIGQALIQSLVPDALVIAPATGFSATVFTGEPFVPVSTNFLLTNAGTNTLPWSLENLPAWLNASTNGGTLAVNGNASVQINLSAAASSLAAGSYNAAILFSNANTAVAQSRFFLLQITDPLIIAPAQGFSAIGRTNGPFSPSSQTFTLSNAVMASLDWQIGNTSAWLNVSPSAGTLAGGAQTNLIVSLNSTASNLLAGTYTATIFFTNAADGLAQSRQFNLFIGGSLVLNGGFETGDFSGWTLTGNGYPYNYVDGMFIPPHSGSYCALLGEANSLDYLSQDVPTLPKQNYLLSLWINNPLAGSASNPNEFSVAWNGATLFDQVNLPQLNWTNLQFIVTAAGIASPLQIGGRNDHNYIGLDDVSLTPIPAATLRMLPSTTNGLLNFSWNVLTGLVYVVQFQTNLLQTNWQTLQTITATNSPVIFADTNFANGSPRKFYRLLLLP